MPADDDWGEPQTSNIHDLAGSGPCAGIYQGYKEVNGDFGISRLHTFIDDGRRVSVWGKAHLNTLLEGREGELVKIAMTGKEIELGGGKKMKEYMLWSKGRVAGAPTPPQRRLEAPDEDFKQGTEDPKVEGPLGADEATRMRVRRFVIACKDAGIDEEMRHELIKFWTFGETSSAKDLSEDQMTSLMEVVMRYRRGKVDIRYNEDGELYLETPGGIKKVSPRG